MADKFLFVKFRRHTRPYGAGEWARFSAERAARLVSSGAADFCDDKGVVQVADAQAKAKAKVPEASREQPPREEPPKDPLAA